MTLAWTRLLCPTRRKSLHGSSESMNTGAGRQELERDYDRILFAAPTRRLADKTQVFPLEENVAIRNRLTHSHEVSNLARSIGMRLAFDHPEQVFKDEHQPLQVQRSVPALLAAVGLAHDLGNPPFGHQGEAAIREWFKENSENVDQHDDFLRFDGNAQTFRLLTRLQVLNDEFGLNLTVATLAALLKYPSLHDSNDRGGFKKFGVFESERAIAEEVWSETGLRAGVRHPLAYVMEACDDIAYSVIDAEDTVKKGYASYYDLIDYLTSNAPDDPVVQGVVEVAQKKNAEFKKESLSSRELNDISMQMFRVKAIAMMVVAATDVFVKNIDSMLGFTIPPGFDLVENSPCSVLCSTLKAFDRHHGFRHSEVLRLELEGNNYIKGLMTLLWPAISTPKNRRSPFEKYAYGKISENYRRVYESSGQTRYAAQRLLCDAISGMTEQYLMREYEELSELHSGAS
ncbi:MAG: dNTP triphosphohydrolase [Gammaproteobacteria bacterium]|nr:dNTP triphosphohydrolase [Gammaproteobacteria bacterium]